MHMSLGVIAADISGLLACQGHHHTFLDLRD
jgi:hypothetical protein